MITSTSQYKGNLRTQAIHLRSNTEIITDAPVDNNGKGEAFSPTDLVATALGSCMMTIMGIKAAAKDLDITGTKCEITKVMAANPRRIQKVIVNIHMPSDKTYTEKDRKLLEKAALTCPVAQSLHESIEQDVHFTW